MCSAGWEGRKPYSDNDINILQLLRCPGPTEVSLLHPGLIRSGQYGMLCNYNMKIFVAPPSSITVQDFCCVAEQCTILFSNICIVQRIWDISKISTEDWNELTANGNKLIERRRVQESRLYEDCYFYHYTLLISF